MVFSIVGETADQLRSVYKTVHHKSRMFRTMGYKIRPFLLDEVKSSLRNPAYNLRLFKIYLRDLIPQLIDDDLNVVATLEDEDDDDPKQPLFLLSLNITSTSFDEGLYGVIIDWLREQLCCGHSHTANYKILLLLTFEKGGIAATQDADSRLESFIAKHKGQYLLDLAEIEAQQQEFPEQYKPGYLLHLGKHREVQEEDVWNWYRIDLRNDKEITRENDEYYQRHIGSKIGPTTRMEKLERLLKEELREYNKQFISTTTE